MGRVPPNALIMIAIGKSQSDEHRFDRLPTRARRGQRVGFCQIGVRFDDNVGFNRDNKIRELLEVRSTAATH